MPVAIAGFHALFLIVPPGPLFVTSVRSSRRIPIFPPQPAACIAPSRLQTGFLPSLEDWDRLIAACQAHGCYLFSDEMYRGLGGRWASLRPFIFPLPDRSC